MQTGKWLKEHPETYGLIVILSIILACGITASPEPTYTVDPGTTTCTASPTVDPTATPTPEPTETATQTPENTPTATPTPPQSPISTPTPPISPLQTPATVMLPTTGGNP